MRVGTPYLHCQDGEGQFKRCSLTCSKYSAFHTRCANTAPLQPRQRNGQRQSKHNQLLHLLTSYRMTLVQQTIFPLMIAEARVIQINNNPTCATIRLLQPCLRRGSAAARSNRKQSHQRQRRVVQYAAVIQFSDKSRIHVVLNACILIH